MFAATLTEGPHSFSVTATETDRGGDRGHERAAPRRSPGQPDGADDPGDDLPRVPERPQRLVHAGHDRWTCADPGGSGVARCPGTETLDAARADRDQNAPNNIQSRNLTIRRTATDRVGRGGVRRTDPLRRPRPDSGPAEAAGRRLPHRRRADVHVEPRGNDTSASSGTRSGSRRPVAPPGSWRRCRTWTAGRSSRRCAPPPRRLTPLQRVTWYVRYYDVAGNHATRRSARSRSTPRVPPAPAITGGPVGPTRAAPPCSRGRAPPPPSAGTSPPSAQTRRLCSRVGRRGAAPTLTALADGDYVFRVAQISAWGWSAPRRPATSRSTPSPPAPAVITGRPGAGGGEFCVDHRAGRRSRWVVFNAGGSQIGPAADTPRRSASVTRPRGRLLRVPASSRSTPRATSRRRRARPSASRRRGARRRRPPPRPRCCPPRTPPGLYRARPASPSHAHAGAAVGPTAPPAPASTTCSSSGPSEGRQRRGG